MLQHRLPLLCSVVFALLACVAEATRYGPVCAEVCQSTFYYYPTAYDNCTDGTCICSSRVATSSYALCIDHYCGRKRDIKPALKIVTEYCEDYLVELAYSYDDALAYGKEHMSNEIVDVTTQVMTVPFLLSEEYYSTNYRSYKTYYENFDSSEYMGIGITAYFVMFMLLACARQILIKLFPRSVLWHNRFVTKFRKYFVIPAFFGTKHAIPSKLLGVPLGLMPTSYEALVLAGFFSISIIFCFVHYDIFDNDTIFGDRRMLLSRVLADRTGIVSFGHLPLLYIFGGRNNIFRYITGWSMQTFMLYHRWIARSMFLHAVLHSVGYTAYGLLYGAPTFATFFYDAYFRWGVAATVIAGFVLIQATYVLRHRWYEIFLILHILFVIMFTVSLWYHCDILGYMEYVYASIAIWAFDRAVRLLRLVMYGSITPSGTKAKASIVGEMIELSIDPPKVPWHIRPGQYAYIYFAKFKFWESHPFSLFEVRDGRHIYVAKPKEGITKMVYNYLQKQPEKSAVIRLGVEGPYGHHFAVETFDTVLLIGGGVGITALMMYAVRARKLRATGQHVIIYWATRHETNITYVRQALSDLLSGENPIELHIYVTSKQYNHLKETEKNSVSGEDSHSESEKINLDVIESSVTYGRPDFETIIEKSILESSGSLIVAVCGPEPINDICRAAVAVNLDKGRGRVEYFEETGMWA
ncbi:FAD-binding domain-containing protein [Dipodascopsis uninucleata]